MALMGVFKEVTEGIYGWKVETIKTSTEKGFVPQKGRWQVERSFLIWLQFFRRLSRDFEKTNESAQAFVQLAFITIILNRLG
ncbi:MAG: transposase [Bacteroidia bacterium]